LGTSETAKGEMIEDIQNNVSFTFNGWTPAIQVWRAGEAFERELPYIAVDYIETSGKLFPSLADIVERVDDLRYEYAYCELELVNITCYAKKYHNNNAIRGLEFADEILKRIRQRILSRWTDNILYKYNASVDRGQALPIRNLTKFDTETATRIHELELNVFLRTDVRWYRVLTPDTEVEEKAKIAYIILNNKNNIRINTS
jgi:hypothetical protein